MAPRADEAMAPAGVGSAQAHDGLPLAPVADEGRGEVVKMSGPDRNLPWMHDPPLPIPDLVPSGFSSNCDLAWGAEVYFLPFRGVVVGDYVLRAVHVGSPPEFKAFERKQKGLAPLSLEFDLAASAKPIIYPRDTRRRAARVVSASSYHLQKNVAANERGETCEVSFHGYDPEIETFASRLDR